MDLDLARELIVDNDTKIVLLVMDGLGGLPHPQTGKTELQTARTPNLDRLARASDLGLTVPVAPGVTPGSGPGHLALFGYDPLRFTVGRGALEAVGIDFDLRDGDVAARGNFCTVDGSGRIVDRRAGRIPTEESAELCAILREVRLDGVEIFVEPVREHRFLFVMRGPGLADQLSETDPQREGLPPLPVRPLTPEAEETARLANVFIEEARRRLAGREQANMVLLRGFAKRPHFPQMPQIFNLRAAAIALYPMYRGLAKLVGMTALDGGHDISDEFETVRSYYNEFDYFFVHYKKTDAAGEDGDFDRKVAAIEELDAALTALLDLRPDVLMITGDHSTPAIMAAHSWHPVPFLLHSQLTRSSGADHFDEVTCRGGSLGTFPAKDAFYLALAHAARFTKYGA